MRGGGVHTIAFGLRFQAVVRTTTETVYPADSIYLATDKGERRRSGSYYTPDHIVDHIVQRAVGSKCIEIARELDQEILDVEKAIESCGGDDSNLREKLQDLQGRFDDRILGLRILDPAMGSGHFLIRTCQYLAEEIATNPYTADPEADELSGDESIVTFWKRRVAERCLFGTDINPLAVELAKLAIWLETVAADAPLTFLDHHFQCGDSIVGSRIKDLNTLPHDKGLFEGRFSEEVNAALPKLLGPLREIQDIASDNVEHVKTKERIYRRRFVPIQNRFRLVADLWTAEAMKHGRVASDQYADVVAHLGTQKRFAKIVARAWASNTLSDMESKGIRPLHWELAFPEVFLSGAADFTAGFDVIIGNPPYDVLSEKEIGQNIDDLKTFIALDDSLSPSLVGKNNLYKLFICRSIELLREKGQFSFIVPMALLGDEQAREIRRLLITQGNFREIHAFPQKDNPNRRVFKDAKLSTTFFTYEKGKQDHQQAHAFTSYVHSAGDIDADSPSLSLATDSIPLFDPSNLTIVSCGQADWDLAISLADSDVARLGNFVEFFQGEVNQTVATRLGFLTDQSSGRLVQRGACISLYKLRDASQGEDIYLDISAFLEGKKKGSKAFHHQLTRVALQESSPQNNFRRIISCRVPAGEFCNHTINYTTETHSKIPLELVLFVLNSAAAEWYFRLGSTNAHVSHYQLKNIPCPKFGIAKGPIDEDIIAELGRHINEQAWLVVRELLIGLATSEKCSPTLEECIRGLVVYIEDQEDGRGEIARAQRSNLSPNAAAAQEVLDRAYLAMIGVEEDQYDFIKVRLSEML